MLRCRRFNGEPDPIVASAAKEILDEVWHREDDSDVRGAAVRVYDALFDAFSDTETEERRRQRDTLGEERQNELQVNHASTPLEGMAKNSTGRQDYFSQYLSGLRP